jgi:hypothetical protein
MLVVVITILTTLTTMAAAYAGEGGGDDDDGNKQKAEDDSAAAIADFDNNDVERAGFDCISIAANDVEIEQPEESATLSVCKEMGSSTLGFEPDDFTLTVTGNGPSPDEFAGDANCVDVDIGPGEYEIIESGPFFLPHSIRIEGDCLDENPADVGSRTTGETQAGETQECTFTNTITD